MDRISSLRATITDRKWLRKTWDVLKAYSSFIGPGIQVSVAYMDPGNYSTAVSGGASYEYKLLFIVLVSNFFAVVSQILAARLGAVTGSNLAENCRKHLPRWLCIALYICTEIAIIATDLAEVVGTAISSNISFKIPLSVGVILTVIDVMVVLAAYDPKGPMWVVRYFEYFVSALVVAVVACFCVELTKIHPENPQNIFWGFFPSTDSFERKASFLSCAILGATVMPHSSYLGSGIVQPRLREYDEEHKRLNASDKNYQPSLSAIKYCMRYTIAELVISLCTVAVFVNAAILIVAGATMYKTEDAYDADLFSIHSMSSTLLGPAAGTVFALASSFSGQSAGVVCTLAGQMVSEGFVEWSVKPWLRRIITRMLAIAPCLVMASTVGRQGLASVSNSSQVVLSMSSPFVCAPLIYFTSSKYVMSVPVQSDEVTNGINEDSGAVDLGSSGYSRMESESGRLYKDSSSSMSFKISGAGIFVLVSSLNLFSLVSMALGVKDAEL